MSKIMTLIVPVKGGKVLLGLKKRDFGIGRWNGFGGKVESGETIEAAAKREMLEEVGLTAILIQKLGSLDFHFHNKSDILTVHFFKALEFAGEPVESDEMCPQWFDLDNIPFEKMWPSDIYWYPLFLSDQKFSGHFLFDEHGEKVLDYKLEKV